VVTKKFFPVLRKIGTKENILADFINRRHNTEAAMEEFSKVGMPDMTPLRVTDCSFKLTDPWWAILTKSTCSFSTIGATTKPECSHTGIQVCANNSHGTVNWRVDSAVTTQE